MELLDQVTYYNEYVRGFGSATAAGLLVPCMLFTGFGGGIDAFLANPGILTFVPILVIGRLNELKESTLSSINLKNNNGNRLQVLLTIFTNHYKIGDKHGACIMLTVLNMG